MSAAAFDANWKPPKHWPPIQEAFSGNRNVRRPPMPNSLRNGTSGTVARQETLQAKKLRRTINALFSRLRGRRTTIPRQGSATSVEADYTVRRGGGDSCRQVGRTKRHSRTYWQKSLNRKLLDDVIRDGRGWWKACNVQYDESKNGRHWFPARQCLSTV